MLSQHLQYQGNNTPSSSGPHSLHNFCSFSLGCFCSGGYFPLFQALIVISSKRPFLTGQPKKHAPPPKLLSCHPIFMSLCSFDNFKTHLLGPVEGKLPEHWNLTNLVHYSNRSAEENLTGAQKYLLNK